MGKLSMAILLFCRGGLKRKNENLLLLKKRALSDFLLLDIRLFFIKEILPHIVVIFSAFSATYIPESEKNINPMKILNNLEKRKIYSLNSKLDNTRYYL